MNVCVNKVEYDFTLVLSGISELTADAEDRLFESGCDDATLVVRSGRVRLDFTRAAPSFQDAVASAIRDVRRAGFVPDLEKELDSPSQNHTTPIPATPVLGEPLRGK